MSTASSAMPRNWRVEHISDEGLEEWTRMHMRAFADTDNALADAIFPPIFTEKNIANITNSHRHMLREAPNNLFLMQVLDEESGVIAGGGEFLYAPEGLNRSEHVDVDWNTEANAHDRAFAQRAFDAFHAERVKSFTGPHALIVMLFTNPDYERQGVASALIQWACQKADELGLKTFVESSPRGRAVYPRFGFVETKAFDLTWPDFRDKPPVIWHQMQREAEHAQ